MSTAAILLTLAALGMAPADPAALASPPPLSSTTLVLARLDLRTAPLQTWARALQENASQFVPMWDWHAIQAPAAAFDASAARAGTTTAWIVGDLATLDASPPFVVCLDVPAEARELMVEDLAAIGIEAFAGSEGVRLGDREAIAAIDRLPRDPRPELLATLASQTSPLAAVFELPEPLRRALAETGVRLPGALADADPGLLIGAVRQVVVTGAPAPFELHARAVVIGAEPASAVGDRVAGAIARLTEVAVSGSRALSDLLRPAVEGSTLHLALDRERLAAIARELRPVIDRAQRDAASMRVAAQARNVLMAMQIYANDKDDAWPPELTALAAPTAYVQRDALVTPAGAPWVYFRPPGPLAQTRPDRMILADVDPTGKAWPAQGVVVGFVDGHVEVVDEARFQALCAAVNPG